MSRRSRNACPTHARAAGATGCCSGGMQTLAAIRLSKATVRTMKQNLFWTAIYNVIAIPIAAGVLYPLGILLNPAIGALAMSASSITVATNAVLLKRVEPELRAVRVGSPLLLPLPRQGRHLQRRHSTAWNHCTVHQRRLRHTHGTAAPHRMHREC
jgi:hypothetical protein